MQKLVISGKLYHLKVCPSCNGSGSRNTINNGLTFTKGCTLCNNTGKIETLVEYETFEEK